MSEDRTPEPTPDEVARLHARFAQLAVEVVVPAYDVAVDVLGISDERAQEWLLGLLWATFADGYAHGGIELVAQGVEAGVDVRVHLYDDAGRVVDSDAEDGALESDEDEGAGA